MGHGGWRDQEERRPRVWHDVRLMCDCSSCRLRFHPADAQGLFFACPSVACLETCATLKQSSFSVFLHKCFHPLLLHSDDQCSCPFRCARIVLSRPWASPAASRLVSDFESLRSLTRDKSMPSSPK